MRRLVRSLVVCVLSLTLLGWFGNSQSAYGANLTQLAQNSPFLFAEVTVRNPLEDTLGKIGKKIDLNNSNIRLFRELPGFYPNLASKIIKYAPYEQVEDVLNIPGLSERQTNLLNENLDRFSAVPENVDLTGGDDRINKSYYR